MADKRAEDLKRGDRVWIGAVGWRCLLKVRRVRNASWIGGEIGDAIALHWRSHGRSRQQHVKPGTIITVQEIMDK